MQYLMLIAGSEAAWAARPADETAALMERITAWWSEQAAAGRIVGGHELEPSSTATTVRIGEDGTVAVSDGPYIEAKEMIGGYGVIEAPDLDAALAVASGWPVLGDVLEVRPIVVRG